MSGASAVRMSEVQHRSVFGRVCDTLSNIDCKTVYGISVTLFAGISQACVLLYHFRGLTNVSPCTGSDNLSFCPVFNGTIA